MDDNYLRQRTDEILRERIRLGMTGGEYMPGEEYVDADIGYAMEPHMGGSGTRAGAKKGWKTRRANARRAPARRCVVKKRAPAKRRVVAKRKKTSSKGRVPSAKHCNRLKTNYAQDVCNFRRIYYDDNHKLIPYNEARRKLSGVYEHAPKKRTKRVGPHGLRHCKRLKTDLGQAVCDYRKYVYDVDGVIVPYLEAKRHISSTFAKKEKKPCKTQSNQWLRFLCRYRKRHEGEYEGMEGQKQLFRHAAQEYNAMKEGEGDGYGGDGYSHLY